jgi:prepilin-type N-terminal cleavage/methylation domain-containing protein
MAVLVYTTKRNWALSRGSGLAPALYRATMKTNFSKGPQAFTLVEIMIVVAIIALLASIAVPGFLRARKRSQASRVINDLRLIDNALDLYAIETNKSTGNPVNVSDWTKYMKVGTNLYLTGKDILGTSYGNQVVDTIPKVPTSTYNSLSDVAPSSFWSPYY